MTERGSRDMLVYPCNSTNRDMPVLGVFAKSRNFMETRKISITRTTHTRAFFPTFFLVCIDGLDILDRYVWMTYGSLPAETSSNQYHPSHLSMTVEKLPTNGNPRNPVTHNGWAQQNLSLALCKMWGGDGGQIFLSGISKKNIEISAISVHDKFFCPRDPIIKFWLLHKAAEFITKKIHA